MLHLFDQIIHVMDIRINSEGSCDTEDTNKFSIN